MKSQQESITVCYDDFKPEPRPDGRINLSNPYLESTEKDILYHLAKDTASLDFVAEFGDVKFVCMGGTAIRMKEFAKLVSQRLHIALPKEGPIDLSIESHRFSMYKVGPVLAVSHGMGGPSLSILLHELFKLLYHAQCTNVTFFRIGTSGGIGVPPGTVVISNKEAVNERLEPYYELNILGKIVRRPTYFDEQLVQELEQVAETQHNEYQTVLGKTMCANDFYEAQSRLDGAFCRISLEQKMARLKELNQAGVFNIEMEATVFASMCRSAGIPGAIVCVTLLDRLMGDQVSFEQEQMYSEYQRRPQELVLKFIEQRLKRHQNGASANGASQCNGH